MSHALVSCLGGEKMAKVLEEGKDLNWKPQDQTCTSCGTTYKIGIEDLRTDFFATDYHTKCPQPKCGHINKYGDYLKVPSHINTQIANRAWNKRILKAIILFAFLVILLALFLW